MMPALGGHGPADCGTSCISNTRGLRPLRRCLAFFMRLCTLGAMCSCSDILNLLQTIDSFRAYVVCLVRYFERITNK